MYIEEDNQNVWGSRKIFLAAMLSQTLGANTIILLPQQAALYGATGHVLLYFAIYIFIGIPLFYMEYVTGQFTGRNCVEVWEARPCLSHIGYVQIFWQLAYVTFTHAFSAFVLHYFFISFEDPIPYYLCGPWTTKDCNVLFHNYTIHQDCLNVKSRLAYCTRLCETFPEYQYWRYRILGQNKQEYFLAWRVTLASALICVALYFSSFRRIQSVKWVLVFCATFLIIARITFLIGSMLQKGIVVKFEDAMDIDFSVFANYIEFSACVVEVLYSLNVGTGISFNLSSKSSFRSPCYSNTVIVVVVTAAITIIGICTNAMMLCPYSFKYNVHPSAVTKYPMFITYEFIPRLLDVYESKAFWLVTCYSFITICFFSVNSIIISSFIDVISKKNSKIARYSGLITGVVIVSLYILTIPLMGNKSFFFIMALQRGINFLPIFSVLIECFVFLICYGFGKFSEDVHFMLGVQPKPFVKVSWVMSIFVLIYVSGVEFYTVYDRRDQSLANTVSWWILCCIIIVTILITIVRIFKAILYGQKLEVEIGLDDSWGPKSEILQRSRAMFTTHAMTKEYIYRQYHLQAGIIKRQRNCNIRVERY